MNLSKCLSMLRYIRHRRYIYQNIGLIIKQIKRVNDISPFFLLWCIQRVFASFSVEFILVLNMVIPAELIPLTLFYTDLNSADAEAQTR